MFVETKYYCEKCNKKFLIEAECTRHEKNCGHKNTFTCNKCGKNHGELWNFVCNLIDVYYREDVVN